MTAFLKIDECHMCHRALPWEYVPAILVGGRSLAGTGVWRSQLVEGACPDCSVAAQRQQQDSAVRAAERQRIVQLLGGEKPYRDFTFERFVRSEHNQAALDCATRFNPTTENLYLWGACGVGKTHLSRAIARRAVEESLSVMIIAAFQISRRIRMKEPEKEQAAIDELASVDVLVIDDLGTGSESLFAQHILQEILDARDFNDQAGVVIASRYSLDQLAKKLGDDSLPSRLAGRCRVVRLGGSDWRLVQKSQGQTR